MTEIRAELRQLLSGNVAIADGILPPLVFVAVNAAWDVIPAAVSGVGVAVAISMFRLIQRRSIRFAVTGLIGTILAAAIAIRSGSAEGYFLPGIISGAVTTIALAVSLPMRRPAVAISSWLARGWPLEWYWHPRVRPAYSRATALWAVFFGIRTWIQWSLYSDGEVEWLAVARVAMGWPALLALLITTYLLGRRWLLGLRGPSVQEFEAGSPPPWHGQRSGF